MRDRPFIIVGGGGHAKVVWSLLDDLGLEVLGFSDASPNAAALAQVGVRYLGTDDQVMERSPESVNLANGLGSTKETALRRRVFEKFKAARFEFPSLVHRSAVVARGCSLGEGAQIMAGVILQTGSTVGINSILNTRCAVDHDCSIGAHAHIAPGVVFSGGVQVGDGAHVGTGAVAIQGVSIGGGAVVGAGAVVIRDVRPSVVVTGVPAKERPGDNI